MCRPDPQGLKVALLTPKGCGAIAMIRVVGARAWECASGHVNGTHGPLPKQPVAGRIYYGTWRDDLGAVDDVLLCPNTTCRAANGQRTVVVDVSTHGSTRIIQRVVLSLEADGAVFYEHGTAGTSWNPKSLIESECDVLLPTLVTRRAALLVARQRTALPAYLESLIENQGRMQARDLRANLTRLRDYSARSRPIIRGFVVAVIGPANVGKSTIANLLAGYPASIVSPGPGTTRDWVESKAAVEGIPVTVIDTPPMHLPNENTGSSESKRHRRLPTSVDLVLLVNNLQQPWSTTRRCIEAVEGWATEFIPIINASDGTPLWSPDRIAECTPIRSVFIDGTSLSARTVLWRAIMARLDLPEPGDVRPCLFSNRQFEALDALLSKRSEKVIDSLGAWYLEQFNPPL